MTYKERMAISIGAALVVGLCLGVVINMESVTPNDTPSPTPASTTLYRIICEGTHGDMRALSIGPPTMRHGVTSWVPVGGQDSVMILLPCMAAPAVLLDPSPSPLASPKP